MMVRRTDDSDPFNAGWNGCLDEIAALGLVIVPKEPTAPMIEAARRVVSGWPRHDTLAAAYRAMVGVTFHNGERGNGTDGN